MNSKKTEKSIIGQINDMSHKLVLILVVPICLSLVLMLFYAGKYSRAISRMNTIASLKNIVALQIPETAWNIVSGRDSIEESRIYHSIENVEKVIDEVRNATGEENRLSLIVANRTMKTLEKYVNQIRNNINNEVPVAENEAVLVEIREVANLVDSMLNEYVAKEIASTGRMSLTLKAVIMVTAIIETFIVIMALYIRKQSMKKTSIFVKKPIDNLEKVAKALAEGTLDARIKETEVTELRNLTFQVNTMADRLETMMKKSIEDERNLRKAELRTLQAQINPHFLYNTLDAIVWKAEAEDKTEVIALTSALSDFFRISLSSGADWIPLSQEKKHIEGYLKIQQTRYRDIMRYEIDIPDEIGHFYILKLLLQPLVENALYHGIKIKRGGGVIKVTVRLEDNYLLFEVKDSGIGMTPMQIYNLQDRMRKGQPFLSEKSGGFGLVNVNLRIRLYYNQTQGLDISSDGGGTTVGFKVPCRTREEVMEYEGISS
ncbi:sensor histidine kinase [Butyrivibrio sp. NC3005]|uniref:sensor histidine kinase n=1 Tax=Butyrivibrio sp. NC3005 TaxID=1280685 RepID=UPI0004287B4D|nr:histidine kinase [Butyrivibrio sp. NC3005]